MKNLIRGAPLLLGALLAAGCAFVDRNAPLKYAAKTPAAPVMIAQVQLTNFVDERAESRKLGDVRNGYGMRTATIWAADPVDAWVTGALAQELRAAGVKVLGSEECSPYAPVLSGQVIQASCAMMFTYEATVTLRMTLESNGRTVLSRSYTKDVTGGLNWTGSSKECGDIMDSALRGLLGQAVPEIVKALKGLEPPAVEVQP